MLREELRRYPIDDGQILPTRLGNAIRRFEEYGWNRYRLDSQSLWSRLISVVPEPVRKQVDTAQVGVDFFVCLLYGHIAVAITAITVIAVRGNSTWALLAGVVVPLLLVPLWYRLAVATTDQWAVAVQALVDLGRVPLAAALGSIMPTAIEEERTMWERVSRFSSREYDTERGKLLSEFRAKPKGDDHPHKATGIDQRAALTPLRPNGESDPGVGGSSALRTPLARPGHSRRSRLIWAQRRRISVHTHQRPSGSGVGGSRWVCRPFHNHHGLRFVRLNQLRRDCFGGGELAAGQLGNLGHGIPLLSSGVPARRVLAHLAGTFQLWMLTG